MSELNKNQVEAVNRIIADYIGRKNTDHTWYGHSVLGTVGCWRCGLPKNPENETVECISHPDIRPPDYTSEDSPRRLLAEVEAKVIAEFGNEKLFHMIERGCNFWDVPFATAEQRAIAIVRTIGRWSEVENLG